jgi:hypothetical protein
MWRFLVTTGALVLAAGLGGCGSSGGGGEPQTNPWLGSWTQGGTQSTTCGAVIETTDLSGVVVISAGTKSGTIQTSTNGCVLTWDVSGDSATLASGQSCTFLVFGTNATVSWTAGSVSLSGLTITGTAGGSADNGCSAVDQQLTLTKM